MSYRKLTDTLKQVALHYKADMNEASKYIKSNHYHTQMGANGSHTDARDFAPMVAAWGIVGNTPEERAEDIHNKIDILMAVFSSPDRSQRKPYLDMIFDLADSMDYDKLDMDNPEDVHRLIKCSILDQTLLEKRNENPEYFQERYPTIADRDLADALTSFRSKATAYVLTNLQSQPLVTPGKPRDNHDILVGLTLPHYSPVVDRAIYDCSMQFALKQLAQVRAGIQNGTGPANFYNMPILTSMLPFVGKEIADLQSISPDDKETLTQYFSFVVDDNLLNQQNKKMGGLEEAALPYGTDAVYIDGIPYDQFFEQNYKAKFNHDDTYPLIASIMLNENHRVDIVHSYRDEAGEMKYEAKTLKASISPEQEKQYLKQQGYSWIRRTLFNWWPFRIESLQEKLDRAANDPQTEERHKSIVQMQKEKIETRIEQRKPKQQSENDQLEKEIMEKIKQRDAETQRLKTSVENSVAKWGENSAIGILGKQVENSYQEIADGLGISDMAARYDNIAVILAKQVLYTQLCNERATVAEGEIGRIEQGLMGDGKPETIKSNIEAAAKNLAQDPMLKNLFHQKVGANPEKGDYPTFNGFANLVINGGCKALTQEYNVMRSEANAKQHQPAPIEPVSTLQKQNPPNVIS